MTTGPGLIRNRSATSSVPCSAHDALRHAASGVTVQYATSAATTNANEDYTPAIGTLSFAAGQTSASFSVALKNDTVNEANEPVNLVLANPSGGAKLGSQPTAVLTIFDDE